MAPPKKIAPQKEPASPIAVASPIIKIYPRFTPSWFYIRDTIVVNSDLSTEIKAEIDYRKIKPGSTLLLMARNIEHAKNYVLKLEGFPLIILAESYDSKGGAIDTSGSPGKHGVAGAHGENRGVGANVRVGGRGGDGEAASPGKPASSLTLIAAKIIQARLIAQGGAGGKGGAGGAGGGGAPGHAGHTGKFAAIEPGKSGNGGNGGDGADGGSGAQILVRYVTVDKPLQLNATGGGGGSGGSSGPGGKASSIGLPAGWEASLKNGEPGKSGTMGHAGSDVPPIQRQFSNELEWWAYVIQSLGPLDQIWAKYRTRVGEYWFRNYQPSSASKLGWLAAAGAIHEFEAAVRLWNQADEARLFRQYLGFHQSPIGVPYNFFLVPEFPRYEEVVTDYGPMVQPLFVLASELLVNAADVANNRGRLSGELVHVQGLATALASDLSAAEAGLTATNDERKAAELRIAANQAKLDAVQHKMAEEQMELTAGKILGTVAAVAGAIVAVAGAVYSGGSSVAAAAACIGLLVDIHGATEQSGSKDNIIDDFKNNSSGWVDWNAEGGPKLTKEADKFVGGLEDLVKKSKDFYDKFQTAKELFEAKVDGELQNQEKELLTERIELTMARNIVELKTLQGGFQVSAAKQRKATAEADIQNLKEQAQTLGASIAFLANTTRILVRHAQGYADYLTKYRFYAARAVDLWTSETEWSKSFSFAYGYLHPDVEEHAYLAASRGDPSRMLGLLQDYLETWATLPELVKLRDDYEKHLSRLLPDRKFVAITDPQSLSFFRNARTLSVSVDGIPADRLAPKVQKVYVALVGATSQFPNVTIWVEHPGQPLGAPPATSPIECTFDKSDFRPIPDDISFHLRGRDPTAVWRLSLDTDSAANVDLAGLTEILLTIDYRYIPA